MLCKLHYTQPSQREFGPPVVKFTQFVGRAQRIARTPVGSESNTICADVVTHAYFQQGNNFRQFENEELIELNFNLNQQ